MRDGTLDIGPLDHLVARCTIAAHDLLSLLTALSSALCCCSAPLLLQYAVDKIDSITLSITVN